MGYPTDEDFRDRSAPPGVILRQAKESRMAILADVGFEIERAHSLGFGLFHSAHEGYAVIQEEFDELKAHVWTNQKKRDLKKMRDEAIQLAAMAVKFVESLDAGNGRV